MLEDILPDSSEPQSLLLMSTHQLLIMPELSKPQPKSLEPQLSQPLLPHRSQLKLLEQPKLLEQLKLLDKALPLKLLPHRLQLKLLPHRLQLKLSLNHRLSNLQDKPTESLEETPLSELLKFHQPLESKLVDQELNISHSKNPSLNMTPSKRSLISHTKRDKLNTSQLNIRLKIFHISILINSLIMPLKKELNKELNIFPKKDRLYTPQVKNRLLLLKEPKLLKLLEPQLLHKPPLLDQQLLLEEPKLSEEEPSMSQEEPSMSQEEPSMSEELL